MTRCSWCGDDPLYVEYHDTDWGVPEASSRALFEKLLLDGFQAGLSWITILRKRENFRAAFDNFDAEVMVRYNQKKLDALMQDTGIVRNRAKIAASVTNAQAFLEIEQTPGDFSRYLWNYVDFTPLQTNFKTMKQVPAETDLSKQISKDLKKRGFKFCGPTIVYAFMQAVGMVNDHMTTCPEHAKLAKPIKIKPVA